MNVAATRGRDRIRVLKSMFADPACTGHGPNANVSNLSVLAFPAVDAYPVRLPNNHNTCAKPFTFLTDKTTAGLIKTQVLVGQGVVVWA